MKPRQKKKLSDLSMTPADQEKALAALALVTKLVKGLNVSFSCPACDHFDNGYCEYFSDNVPKDHYQKGCDNWTDPIPF